MIEESSPRRDDRPGEVEPAGVRPQPGGARPRWRYVRAGVMLAVALLSGIVVSSLVVDLGPALRARAEAAGSRAIERRLHIGKLSIRLLRGTFVVEDLVIEGLAPQDRPFLTARRLEASIHWANLLQREVLLNTVEMTDWRMLVETFPGGRHNFPRFVRGDSGQPRARRLVTTLAWVRAHRGEFTYEDHGAPWSTVARNLDITVTKLLDYRGVATFSEGTVRIQRYEAMRADLRTTFKIEGGKVHLDRIDLHTDGAESRLTGVVDLRRWPEQIYQVQSRVQFPRMRQIFFARERFSLFGEGEFTGTFHIYKGGRELKGAFSSELAGVNAYRFPRLRGSLVWLPDRFEVLEAASGFHGGDARFHYRLAPLGTTRRPLARFETQYENVDLAAFTDFLETEGIRLAGRASGRTLLEWPLGRFSERRGEGQIAARPPGDARLLGRTIPAAVKARAAARLPVYGPFNPEPTLERVPIGGQLTFALGPEWVELAPSHVATPATYLEFEGRTAYGERSRLAFHVTSADWQESDRLLAGVLTAFGARTRAVPVGGYGEFDGVMLGSFRGPRVEGRFVGAEVRAWSVIWGTGRARVVVENGYADVADGVFSVGTSEIQVNGRFALGYPRRDGGQELDARLRLLAWPVVDLRNAFGLEGYPIEGRLSGEFHLYGKYDTPFGFGRMQIEEGRAYGEPFERAAVGLRFEGAGVRFDGVHIEKGGGTITGAAYIGWDGTYSFNADGRRIAVESVATLSHPQAPLSGLLQFTATGAATFKSPRYEVRGLVSDLFVRDEGIGQVTTRLGVRGDVLTLEMEAASPRLAVSGSGRVALTPEADAELTFRFIDTSLDPYVRMFEPRLSPFTAVVVSGVLRVAGELGDIDHLLAEATVEDVGLKLFDYEVRNDGPTRLVLDRHILRVDQMRLTGEGTRLELTGGLDLHDQQIALHAKGHANLGILQGFFRDLRSAGEAELVADVQGPLRAPVFSGYASVVNGRIRHFSLPHSLEAINGRVVFDAGGIRLDEVQAALGGGAVRFGGRVGLRGYLPGELSVSASGQAMQLRYPEGFRSVVDAEITLRGDVSDPLLAGTVNVRNAVWTKRFEAGTDLFDLLGEGPPAPATVPGPTLPLQLDVRILAPSALRIESSSARVVASADLTLRGTYDQPVLLGHVEIDRGEVLVEGNRYVVTRGGIDFANPTKIEPFFDVEAETYVRVPGQTYRVVFHVVGTRERFLPELTSDPPLSAIDILSLLFGDVRDPRSAELRALRAPEETEQKLIQTRAARLLASPVSSEVGRVVEETFSVDTFQITPSLGDFSSPQTARLNPTARLTIGKRISGRVYLTFSRALSAASRDQIILLEYNQSDRLSWVISQNEDRTYALDFRVRHSF